jgi:hypothetical protein
MVERNMSNAAMRGIVVLPKSRATSRAQGFGSTDFTVPFSLSDTTAMSPPIP